MERLASLRCLGAELKDAEQLLFDGESAAGLGGGNGMGGAVEGPFLGRRGGRILNEQQ